MLSKILGFINPLRDIVAQIQAPGEDKRKLELAVAEMEFAMHKAVLEQETTRLKEQASIIRAEAQGESPLQRNWRPAVMLMFATIVAYNYMIQPLLVTFLAVPLMEIPPGLWTLLTVGLGGYVGARTVEKLADDYVELRRVTTKE